VQVATRHWTQQAVSRRVPALLTRLQGWVKSESKMHSLTRLVIDFLSIACSQSEVARKQVRKRKNFMKDLERIATSPSSTFLRAACLTLLSVVEPRLAFTLILSEDDESVLLLPLRLAMLVKESFSEFWNSLDVLHYINACQEGTMLLIDAVDRHLICSLRPLLSSMLAAQQSRLQQSLLGFLWDNPWNLTLCMNMVSVALQPCSECNSSRTWLLQIVKTVGFSFFHLLTFNSSVIRNRFGSLCFENGLKTKRLLQRTK